MICLVWKSEIECGCLVAKIGVEGHFTFQAQTRKILEACLGGHLKRKGLIACKDWKRKFTA